MILTGTATPRQKPRYSSWPIFMLPVPEVRHYCSQ